MPFYNSEKYISKAVDSLLLQSYTNWELIAVDDGSNDDSYITLKRLARGDRRIKVLKQDTNMGSAAARNAGLKLAKGRFIAFLDADDYWIRDKLEYQINIMMTNNLAMSHTAYFMLKSQGNVYTYNLSTGFTTFRSLLVKADIGCSTVVLDTSKLSKVYYFPDYKIKQDYALWLTLLREGIVSYRIEKPLVVYRLHSESTTARKPRLFIKHMKLLKDHLKFTRTQAIFYTIMWAFNAWKKHTQVKFI